MAIRVRKSGQWVNVATVSLGTGTTKVARIYDEKSQNSGAGSPSGTGFENRTLNAKDDPQSFVTLESGNVAFSLLSGTYRINWRSSAHDGIQVRSKLVYANDSSFTSTSEVLGESGVSDTSPTSAQTNYYTCGNAFITITEKNYFKIQQAQAAGDWGQPSNLGGAEIYTQVFVEDLTTAAGAGGGGGGGGVTDGDKGNITVTDSGAIWTIDNDVIEEKHINAGGTPSNGKVLTYDSTHATDWSWADPGATVTTDDSPPASPSDGDLWWNSTTGILNVYYQDADGGQWVNATGRTGGNTAGTTIEQLDTSAEVIDTGTDGRFVVKTNNTEKFRIKGDTSNTFANSDDFVLMGGGGAASASAAVTNVINMGTSYFDTGTGLDHRDGSGDWKALKLFLYKNPTGTNAQTIDNVYGFGVSSGVMEIQTNADLGFFVGSAGAGTGKRIERMRILSTGQVNVGGTIATNLKQTTYTMYVLGSFGATSIAASSKSFVIDHPTKENHTLRHGCLEGPEHAVYVRGKTSGSVINLPDYWVGLVHEDSITVNLTPIGNKRVWVESINNNIVTTGSDDSTEYFYTIFGERKDIDKIVVEEEKK